MADKQIFTGSLEKQETTEATVVTIPFDVEKVFGAKRVPVKISINTAEYRTTVFRMHGRYLVVIPKTFRESAGIKAGETVTVEIRHDTEKRTVTIPDDLAEALKNHDLTETFANLSYTHQKEYVKAVNDAKKPETRLRRIEKTVEMVGLRKK